ncbi:integration host factor MihF [Schaalia sp. ZJ405]|uniref:integration host factor, actinobacterial type n=1 Tax=unclassified Schaalia TaxID=2691889 RepID=UPI0013EC76D5|nr:MULTISPECIES: integration host factor, actinobacterial type [unclassified Schaalia]QPK82092.1 integration host factor MihF [Schaalia sp. ZJ405]
MVLPELTPQQRAQALEKATQARKRRAEVKAALKNRQMTVSEVFQLAEHDEAIAKMKAVTMLESLPRVGATTAAKLLDEFNIVASRRIRGLGPIQRQKIIERFER